MDNKVSCESRGAIALGRQMTVEFYDCSAEILADVRRMEEVFLEAARVSGAHVVNSNFHSFEPQGVSGVLVISESHFAVHAWPEHDYAAVDLFTCGAGVDFEVALNSLAQGMKAGRWIVSSMVNRGILHESGQLERLVPIVENGESRGMQLSWKERFERSGARAISCTIDVYHCANDDKLNSGSYVKELSGKLSRAIVRDTDEGKWLLERHDKDVDFFHIFSSGRISGFVSKDNKTVYLSIFTDGFFDPREIAELAMKELRGEYYRMQVQIRQ